MFSLIQSTIFACENALAIHKFTRLKERKKHGCYRIESLIIFQNAAIESPHSDDYDIQNVKHFYANNDKIYS